MSDSLRPSLYRQITSQIIAAIEAGAGSFVMPWHSPDASLSRPRNVLSNKPYRGVNTVVLWASARELGSDAGIWGTYRQWRTLGACPRRGEHATTIIFWKKAEPSSAAQRGQDDEERRGVIARGYGVFNLSQVEGYQAPKPRVLADAERVGRAEAFFGALGITTVEGGEAAYYAPSSDEVHIPSFATFRSALDFYGVLFHEAVHATSAPHRCARPLDARFGCEGYAMEELCAEIGSAFVLADLELAVRPRPDHAAYAASWLKVLRNDASALLAAAAKAQIAVDWMHQAQNQP